MNESSEQLNEFFLALSKAQGEISTAVKDSANPFFKSKYTSLDGCWSACRVPLSKHGLSVIQTILEKESRYFLKTVLGHSSGQYVSSVMPLLLAKTDPQAFGSAVSYCRRYALCAIVGLTQGDEDDDGEKAMAQYRIAPQSRQNELIAPPLNLETFLDKVLTSTGEDLHPTAAKNYLTTLVKPHLSVEKIMEQALSSPQMTQRFINSFNEWSTTNP